MNIFSTEVDDQQWVYSIIASFPTAPAVKRRDCLEDSERITLRIRWNVMWNSNMDGTESWKSIEHFSTLPYIWVPLNGIDFFQHFIISLEQCWLSLCGEMYSNLSNSVSEYQKQFFYGINVQTCLLIGVSIACTSPPPERKRPSTTRPSSRRWPDVD
jgi:hypothetical protein